MKPITIALLLCLFLTACTTPPDGTACEYVGQTFARCWK